MDGIMDFIRDWQPDLIMILILIVGGIIEFIVVFTFAKEKTLRLWHFGGVFATILGLLLLAIRFI